ncbi:Flp pilus assembly complex ATPase component TadA [Patescibacteria group bacterium]|nr:Flp pilus assembly complex ATPase component TadA [Patescibacteria group bacterium]
MSEKIIKTICHYANERGHSHFSLEAKDDNLFCTCGYGENANYLQLDPETELNIKATFRRLVGANENDLFHNKRFKISDAEEIIKGRASLIPSSSGEKLLISLSAEHPRILRLSALGLNKTQRNNFKQAINKKSGIIIITAAEENGASSTYYSLLQLAASKRSAYSIEDFPLHKIEGVNTINSSHYESFNQIIEKLMILDSEIIAVDAALKNSDIKALWRAADSGRLVILTLPLASAAASLKLLRQAGINSKDIAEQIILISAQKLFTRPCSRCAQVFDPGKEIKQNILHRWPISKAYWPQKLYRQRGCTYCQKKKTPPKTAVFEIMHFLSDGRLQKGYEPLIKGALDKAGTGLINIEEIATWAESDTKL